jgi:tRNA(fMet)-specific endonuclease VapC
MATLIDASIVIAAERGRLDLDQLLEERAEQYVALAAVTASELLHGVHRASTAAQRGRREAFVERLLSGLPIIAFDLVVARVHARLWAELAAKGTVIGAHDLQIAATALATSGSVATRDLRSFPKITGLTVERW